MKPKVLVIMGSTASGKSDFGIWCAKQFNGEIVCCDSVSVYKSLDIGSAKTMPDQQQGVVHHMLDILELDEAMDVKLFQELARQKIDDIRARGKLPICVGGTGFYIKALLYDYQFIDEVAVSPDFSNWTNEALHDALKRVDPQQALKIHVNNRQRLIRVHELMAQSHSTRTELNNQQQHECLYDALVYYLMTDRAILMSRINQRVDMMFDQGLVEEVSRVSKNGSVFDYAGLKAIGYKEFKAYFDHEASLDEVREKIKTNTRQFSKRQMTWFRHQLNGTLVDISNINYHKEVSREIRAWINSQD